MGCIFGCYSTFSSHVVQNVIFLYCVAHSVMKLFMWLLYRSPGKKHTSSNIVVIVYLILYSYCVSHSVLSLLIWHSVLLYNNYTVVIFYLMSYFLQSSFSTSSSSSRRSTSSSSTSRCSSGRSSSSFSSTKRLVKSVW